MKKFSALFGVLAMLLSPLSALAAFDTVTHESGGITLELPSTGALFTLNEGTKVNSYTVNSSSFEFSVEANSYFALQIGSAYTFSATSASCSLTVTCEANFSRVAAVCPGTMSAETIVISPASVTSCGSTTNGGSSGGGGGGGGGSSDSAPLTPAPVATPAPAPAPVANPAAAPVQQAFPVGVSQGFSVGGFSHSVTVQSVSASGAVTFVLRSQPLTLTMQKGETKLVDSDGNGTKDLKVTYVSLENNKPVLRFFPLEIAESKATPNVTPAPIAPTAYVFKNLLKLGSKGEEVKQLQLKLKDLTLFAGKVDGNFGKDTEAAVKAFQKANKLDQLGFVGPGTRTALNKGNAPIVAPAPEKKIEVAPAAPKKVLFKSLLKLGSKGEEVRQLQMKLKELGLFAGKVDGNFGKDAVASVKAFQKANKLDQLGHVGPATRAALNK